MILSDLSLVAGLSARSRERLPLAAALRHGDDATGAHVTLVEFHSRPGGGRAAALERVARRWTASLPADAFAALLPLDLHTIPGHGGGGRVAVTPATTGDADRIETIAGRFAALPRPRWMPPPARPPLHVTLDREDHRASAPAGLAVRCDVLHLAVATELPYAGITYQTTFR